MRGPRSTGDLLELTAIDEHGLMALADGGYAQALEVGAANPLTCDREAAQLLADGFARLFGRLPAQQGLQLIAQAEPLDVDAIVERDRTLTDRAVRTVTAAGESARAVAIDRFARAQEHTLRVHSPAVAAMRVRYFVVCPWLAAQRPRRRGGAVRRTVAEHARVIRDLERHVAGLQRDLEAIGIASRALPGREVCELLWTRFAPGPAAAGRSAPAVLGDLVGPLEDAGSPEDAGTLAAGLAAAICREPIDLHDPRGLRIGEWAEAVRYLGAIPEQTWLGWLLYLMSAPRPWTLSVHVTATDRHAERLRHRRRYKQIYGNNRGTEQRGRPLDPDQAAQEQEAEALDAELSLSRAAIYHLSCYLALRDAGGDLDALDELHESIGRELTSACDTHLHHGRGAQRQLWQATLPVGVDAAGRSRKFIGRNVADSVPLVGTSCGSPGGVPLGYAAVGRTLERLDLYDAAHDNHMLLVNGTSGSGKTMATNLLIARCLGQGATGAIIERGGHYGFLASLLPGAHHLQMGGDRHAVCAWDVPDCGHVPADKIDYLLALHAMLIGGRRGHDAGLGATEENLLGRAIRQVYERCAATGESPREMLLQEQLQTGASRESGTQLAEVLRDLAARLHNFVGDGPYAWLCDRPTTIPAGSPLIVFDTQSIPDSFAGAALFVIVEHITSRIAVDRERHLTDAPGAEAPAWAGRSFLVIDELWKLVEHEATGRWVNELARRSRHLALALIAISQQLKDFDNPHGRALLDNAAMKLCLRQERRQLEFVAAELGLSDEEIDAIAALSTVKRESSTAYLVNGSRGRGTVTLRPGDLEYWIATHDPDRDEPLRRQAIRDAGGDSWRALRLLADPAWVAGIGGR